MLLQEEVKEIYVWEDVEVPADLLCFSANTAGSTISLAKTGDPTDVSLESSTNGVNRSDYTTGSKITLTNAGDKVYMRNKSETPTRFSLWSGGYWYFNMTGSISASGDINYLLCKNSTDTVENYSYYNLFRSCSSLTTAPSLPATTLGDYCYYQMFDYCTGLTTIPKLPATTLATYCYTNMFRYCSNIKLSTTKTGDYQNEYRIPTSGTGTTASEALFNMFYSTGGTFTGTPSINTTYYTSNIVV